MYLAAKEVKPIENYKLILIFENNEVKISFDSIKWPNEADIDPETLYEDSVLYSN